MRAGTSEGVVATRGQPASAEAPPQPAPMAGTPAATAQAASSGESPTYTVRPGATPSRAHASSRPSAAGLGSATSSPATTDSIDSAIPVRASNTVAARRVADV